MYFNTQVKRSYLDWNLGHTNVMITKANTAAIWRQIWKGKRCFSKTWHNFENEIKAVRLDRLM